MVRMIFIPATCNDVLADLSRDGLGRLLVEVDDGRNAPRDIFNE